jgi:hypothetical protein
MDNNEITQKQMTYFCEQARAAVTADRVTLVASVNGMTNLAASSREADSNAEVLADIVADLARAIVSIAPGISITINTDDGEPMIIDAETSHIELQKRVIEDVEHGNLG